MPTASVVPMQKSTDKVRIAVVAHSHPSATKGGAEIAAYSLYQGLCQLGYDALFIAACPEKDVDKVTLASEREFLILHRPETYDHFYHIAAANLSRELNALLERERITVVNFHHFFNYGLGVLRDLQTTRALRTVFTIHEYLAICQHHGQMVTNPDKRLCNSASPTACVSCFPDKTRQEFAVRKTTLVDAFAGIDAFVAPSHFLATRYAEWGIDESRLSVIENGLRAVPAAIPLPDKTNQQRWTIGFFGQINPFKGVDLLLDVAERIAADPTLATRIHIRLHGNLIGQSDDFIARVTQYAKAHGVISFLGPYDNSSVSALMADCDYVIVPSRWWENSPVVIQEAYAAGRPVICTGIGGMAEKVVDGVSGLHFRYNDAADLLSVLTKAADARMWSQLANGVPRPIDVLGMAKQYAPLLCGIEDETLDTAEETVATARTRLKEPKVRVTHLRS